MAPEIKELNWRRHSREVLQFQREIYETNFPGFKADERFLRDYGADIRRSLSIDSEGLFVLEEGGRACGFLWVSLISTLVDPCVGYIRNIYVAPDLRGEGYGRQLLDLAESWCRRHGVDRISLDASCCNERAVSIYERCGFDVVRVRMEKCLEPEPWLEDERINLASNADPGL